MWIWSARGGDRLIRACVTIVLHAAHLPGAGLSTHHSPPVFVRLLVDINSKDLMCPKIYFQIVYVHYQGAQRNEIYLDRIQYPNQYAAVKSGLESSVDNVVATVFNRRRQRYFLWNMRPTPL